MLTNQLNDTRTFQVRKQTRTEVSRLLAAAVVSRRFCALLLKDPAEAIKQGFAGEHFSLSADEYQIVMGIRSSSLAEFAQHLEKSLFSTQIPLRAPITENYTVSSWPI